MVLEEDAHVRAGERRDRPAGCRLAAKRQPVTEVEQPVLRERPGRWGRWSTGPRKDGRGWVAHRGASTGLLPAAFPSGRVARPRGHLAWSPIQVRAPRAGPPRPLGKVLMGILPQIRMPAPGRSGTRPSILPIRPRCRLRAGVSLSRSACRELSCGRQVPGGVRWGCGCQERLPVGGKRRGGRAEHGFRESRGSGTVSAKRGSIGLPIVRASESVRSGPSSLSSPAGLRQRESCRYARTP